MNRTTTTLRHLAWACFAIGGCAAPAEVEPLPQGTTDAQAAESSGAMDLGSSVSSGSATSSSGGTAEPPEPSSTGEEDAESSSGEQPAQCPLSTLLQPSLLVDLPEVGQSANPSLAVDATGAWFAFSQETDPGGFPERHEIRLGHIDCGGTIDVEPFTVAPVEGPVSHYDPKVVSDGTQVLVVWSTNDSTQSPLLVTTSAFSLMTHGGDVLYDRTPLATEVNTGWDDGVRPDATRTATGLRLAWLQAADSYDTKRASYQDFGPNGSAMGGDTAPPFRGAGHSYPASSQRAFAYAHENALGASFQTLSSGRRFPVFDALEVSGLRVHDGTSGPWLWALGESANDGSHTLWVAHGGVEQALASDVFDFDVAVRPDGVAALITVERRGGDYAAVLREFDLTASRPPAQPRAVDIETMFTVSRPAIAATERGWLLVWQRSAGQLWIRGMEA